MNLLRELSKSKKFAILITGVVGAIVARLGLPEELATHIAGIIIVLVSVYLHAQGQADIGKEAAKIAPTPVTIRTTTEVPASIDLAGHIDVGLKETE